MADKKTEVTPTEEEKVETTEVEKTEEVETEEKGGNVQITKEEDTKVDYVKIRVDRAKQQTEKSLLKDLGVDKVDDAKKLIEDGKTALEEVRKLQAKLEEQEQEAIANQKRNTLIKLLDEQKVFDSEALVNYVDLDKVEIVNGTIQDAENVVASLKKAKPNFFGSFELTGDKYIKGNEVPKKTPLDKQKEGDNVGAINDYLKSILK